METKEIYENPKITLIMFASADIITASGGIDNGIGEDLGENDGEWL